MGGILGREIGPLVDLGPRNDEGVTTSERADIEERHTDVVFPEKRPGISPSMIRVKMEGTSGS